MIADPELYSVHHSIAERDANILLDYVIPEMVFHEEDIVMDIGCGSGDNTKDVILPRIPKVKKIIGVDIMPKMIEFAKVHKASDEIEYHVADIEDRCSLKTWEGSVSKVFSVYCFNWLRDQRKGFQSLYNLLIPKGEAAVVFLLSAAMWDCYPFIINDSKWKKFLKDIDYHVPDSHHLNHGAEYFKKILEDLGFEVLTCLDENRTYYMNDTQFKIALELFAAPTYHIPNDLKEEFLNDFLTVFKKINGGTSEFHYRALTVHIRKP